MNSPSVSTSEWCLIASSPGSVPKDSAGEGLRARSESSENQRPKRGVVAPKQNTESKGRPRSMLDDTEVLIFDQPKKWYIIASAARPPACSAVDIL